MPWNETPKILIAFVTTALTHHHPFLDYCLSVYLYLATKMSMRSRRFAIVFLDSTVYQFNEYGPYVGLGNKGGPILEWGGVSLEF
jgi:hypothetical protein